MYQPPPPANNYMGAPFQPLGNIFGHVIQILRQHPAVFMAIAALQVIPQLLLSIYLVASNLQQKATLEMQNILDEFQTRSIAADPSVALAGFPWGLSYDSMLSLIILSGATIMFAGIIMRSLALGISVIAVGDSVRGEQPTFFKALKTVAPQLLGLIVWGVIYGCFLTGISLLLIIPCLGIVIWLAVLLMLAVRLMFVPIIIVTEQASIPQAIRRSWQLSKHAFWRIVGVYLLFSLLISIAVSLLTSIITLVFSTSFGPTAGITTAVTQGVSTLLGLLSLPIGYIGYTLVYYDHNRRQTYTMAPPPPPIYQAPRYE